MAQTLQKQENQKGFFTKKKIILFTILFAITIAFLVLAIIEVLDINLTRTFELMGQAIQRNNIVILFLFFLILYPFIRAFNNIYYYYLVLKKMGIKVRKRDWFTLSCIVCFIAFITPSSQGSEAFYIYWLNKRIFDVKKSSAITLANGAVGELANLIVTAPSFIYFCTQYETIKNIPSVSADGSPILFGWGGEGVFWFAIIGVLVDWIVFAGLIILVYSKKTHYWFSLVFHKTKALLGLKHKEKSEIYEETMGEAVFKKEVIKILKWWKTTTYGFIWYLIFNVLMYVYMYFAFRTVSNVDVDFLAVFNWTNVGVTANNFIPLPGSEGSLQLMLQAILQSSFDVSQLQDGVTSTEIINNGIFLWRLFTTQIPALVGLIFLAGYGYKAVRYYRNKKINNNLPIKQGTLFIFDENSYLISSDRQEHYLNLISKNLVNGDVEIADYDKMAKSFEKGSLYLSKRDGYLKRTQEFENQTFTLGNYLRYLIAKKRLVLYNSKILKGYLKTKNYNAIIDFTFFGFRIFVGNYHYYWIQNRSYDEISGRVFFTRTENFFSTWLKKFTFGFDPFYYIYNVVVTKDNDKNIGNNDNFAYINEMNNDQIKVYFKQVPAKEETKNA